MIRPSVVHSIHLPVVRIINVVVSTKADSFLNIELLAKKLPRTIYEPDVFPGLIHRREEPKVTIIMFSTGKIASIGSKSEEMARESINLTISEIAHLQEENLKVKEIKTENVVAIADVGRPINVEKAAKVIGNTIYEPEQFPGVIYHIKKSLAVLIFTSGKLVSAGSKSENEAIHTIHRTYKILEASGCLS